jgi:hypothetical protein
VSFAAKTLSIASQRVFIVVVLVLVYFVIDSVRKIWIHPCTYSTISENLEMLKKTFRRKTEMKSPIGRPRRRWEDNIKLH